MTDTDSGFARRVALASLVITAVVATVLVLLHLADVWLLVFGGVLLAVGVRGLGGLVAARTPLGAEAATALAWLALVGVGVGAALALGPAFLDGVERLRATLPGTLSSLAGLAERYPWLDSLLESAPGALSGEGVGSGLAGRVGDVLSTAVGVVSGAFGALAGIAVVLIVGIYASLSPGAYAGALTAVLPGRARPRARETLDRLAVSLRWWLVGRLASMAVVGVLTGLGLLLLGVPSALTLGALAALLSFVPNVGPVLALVPALLAALSVGPDTALYALALYLAVQVVESYAITPLIQQRAITLPPAFVIVAQLAFGAAFGLLGLLFATPLVVVARETVATLWIGGVLEARAAGTDADDRSAGRAPG